MTGPAPYLHLPGTAREALAFYASVFGCGVVAHTVAEMGQDGPPEAIGHGYLVDGPVALYVADATGDQAPYRADGLMFALLGAAAPDVLRGWFAGLTDGGRVVDDLQRRPWGDWDGQVVDRHGLHWLVGFQDRAGASA